jgi:tyrosinase
MQDDYRSGNKKPLEELIRAWRGIQQLPPEDPNSFFMIAGYHGEPFRGAGWGNSSFWGGYCNHGNVLFPTWHRAYVLRLEDALRSIPGCADVTLPYWDETSPASLENGIPWALTQETFELDGATILNPLASYTLPRRLADHRSSKPDADYTKNAGYRTVRYPLSGLVGTDIDALATKAHNDQFPNYDDNVGLLNINIVKWLTSSITIHDKTDPTKVTVIPTNVHAKYLKCLDAPNYTVFSNSTSAGEWNDNAATRVRSIESPHDSIHLAVGGHDLPDLEVDEIRGANADMGENNTAAFDPIFFFHHCFVDRVFWLWQKRQQATDNFEIIAQYPGTNSTDSQGPTPGTAPNIWLTMDSPLDPFRLVANGQERTYTSRDCFNIETQLGYTYGPGSLDELAAPPGATAFVAEALAALASTKVVHVSGINRGAIRGSFLISAFMDGDEGPVLLGTEAVLSRWNVQGCANCQTHLEARATFDLPATDGNAPSLDKIRIAIGTREKPVMQAAAFATAAHALVETSKQPFFEVEIR